MAAKQDLLLAFVDCVERNGAKLAVPRTTVRTPGHGAWGSSKGAAARGAAVWGREGAEDAGEDAASGAVAKGGMAS